MLPVGVLGINFKTAELAIREAIARVAATLSGERALFFPHPILVLSTCNRTEIYFSGFDLAVVHSELLSYFRKHLEESFEQRLYSYFGVDCFAHLCHVVTGLDSALVGETEIQGQVKLAYTRALALPSALHYLFQKALKIGKQVRGHLGQRTSLYTALWRRTEWRGKRILLIGYSEINRGLISFLAHKGISEITLCTRAVDLVYPNVVGREELKHWQSYDIVVAASSSDDYLIRGEGASQMIFDLSVPRNVDPEVGKTTTLYNIDELTHLEPVEGEFSDLIWENVIKLSQIYQLKTQHVQETVEMGSRL
jgi:glutamyl-tRNA reductase